MSTSARMLQLLALLQNHRYWPGHELATRLEVSPRTLRRDVDRLRDLGYPVDADRGVGGGYQLATGAALPPLVLDDEEAVAIAVGLQTAAHGSIAGIEEAAVQALAKVVQVMPARLRHRVEALRAVTVRGTWGPGAPGPPGETMVDPDLLVTVAQACRDDERLDVSYAARSGERTVRQVEPHRLVSLGRRWYLVAYDLTRHDWRSFRLDRISEPHRSGVRFRPRELPAEDAAAFVRAGIETLPQRYSVDVLVHAPGATVRSEADRWGTVEDLDDDRCRLRMSTDSLDWPAMMLGAVGADFEVVAPPELVDLVADWGRRFTRAAELTREAPPAV
ncbi:YafY family transcriptional regulator [Actinotalea sp. BY-33]|uniref:YafY family transcriptional regulator n=1 Tax=Actinotalea soli TaxID=2819234 RepID=A0A939LQV5_9CELL|nr:YafY family protein [Actinotalea soli]MBO1751355.1 YafY family transcriptional regulator [Actinotalea soli]